MPARPSQHTRFLISVAISVPLLVGAAPRVMADTEIGHSGKPGRHRLVDTAQKPGARCDYVTGDTRAAPATVTVRAPVMYARNRGPGVDRQIVGWRIRVQASDDFVTWSTVRDTGVSKTSAFDTVEAGYQPRTVAVPTDQAVRVRVLMIWYKPGSRTKVSGRATHEVDHYYRYSDGMSEDKTVDGCPADLPG
jgi:hypothetical protein